MREPEAGVAAPKPRQKEPILIVSADTHLEPHAYAARPGMAGDAHCSFRQLVDAALELQAPLLLAGDVFDKCHPDSVTLKKTFQEIDRLADHRNDPGGRKADVRRQSGDEGANRQ